MGQYFLVANLTKESYITPFSLNQGAKLLEHGYLLNDLSQTVLSLLKKEWKGDEIAWVGDYYEPVYESDQYIPSYEYIIQNYKLYSSKLKKLPKKYRYLNNLTLKKTIDLSKVNVKYLDEDPDTFILSPVTFLTALGNGEGGGDLQDEKHHIYEVIGNWAGHELSVSSKIPEEFSLDTSFIFETNSEHYLKSLISSTPTMEKL